jgi:hypothetical protein
VEKGYPRQQTQRGGKLGSKWNIKEKFAFYVFKKLLNYCFGSGSYTVHYRRYKDRPTNALSCMFLYFSQWLLHVSAIQCHPQGATGFLLSLKVKGKVLLWGLIQH